MEWWSEAMLSLQKRNHTDKEEQTVGMEPCREQRKHNRERQKNEEWGTRTGFSGERGDNLRGSKREKETGQNA